MMHMFARKHERDMSEKIALKLVQLACEVIAHDERLFDRSNVLASGLNEDEPYDKPQFAVQDVVQRICR